MRQAKPFAWRATRQEQRAHAGCLTYAGRCDGGVDVGHRVVDGEAGGHGAAGCIDVEGDGPVRRVGFEEEELGDDGSGEGFVDGAVEADDALLNTS